MEYSKRKLFEVLRNTPREGWTTQKIKDLIDSLWRNKTALRWSGFEFPADPAAPVTWDNATKTLTLTPTGGTTPNFAIYSVASDIATFHRFVAAVTKDITDDIEEGFWLFYFDADAETSEQVLTALHNPTEAQEEEIYTDKVIVAWIYWDADNSEAVYFGDERHGSEFPSHVNWWAHSGFNLILKEGLTLDLDNSLGEQFFSIFNDANFFGVAPGKALHEDIEIDYSGILSSNMPLQWFMGTLSDPKPRIYVGDIAPRMFGLWNYYSHQQEEWSLQSLESPFTLVHIYATNCKQYPILAQLGSEEYEDKHRAIQGFYRDRQHIEICMPQKSKLFLFTAICWHSPEGLVFVNASDVSAVMTDANYSQIVAKAEVMDALPRLKTGWPPNPFNYVRVIGLGGDVKIQATAGRFPIFLLGEKQYFGEVSVYIDPLHHGMQYFSMNRSGESRSFEKWDNASNSSVFIMAAYHNKTKAKTLYYGLELHNWEMDPTARGFMHDTLFTEYVDGLAISIANNGIVVQPGRIKDEDFIYPIGLKSPLQCPKYFLYVDGTEGLTWDSYDNLTIPVILDNSNHLQYHDIENIGEMLSTETGDWTCMWVLATMCGQYPIKLIPGTGKGETKEEAEEKNPVTELKQLIDATDFFCEEYIVLGRVPVQDTGETPFFTLTGVTDFKDIDLEKLGKDIYVEDGEFDEVSSELVLHRTQKMPDIRIPIPQPEIPEPLTPDEVKVIDNTKIVHGKLYNQYAINDSRNIAPAGWRVPTVADYLTLISNVDEEGNELRSTDSRYWNTDQDHIPTNLSGFSAKGSGYREESGTFAGLKDGFNSWATDGYFGIEIGQVNAAQETGLEKYGLSLRLIKEDSTDPKYMTDNDGVVYDTVKIGNQVWTADSLSTTKYRNGDAIPEVQEDLDWTALTTHAWCIYDNDVDKDKIDIGKDPEPITWDDIEDKPTTFPPPAHTHVHNDTTSKQGGKAPDEYYHLGEDDHAALEDISELGSLKDYLENLFVAPPAGWTKIMEFASNRVGQLDLETRVDPSNISQSYPASMKMDFGDGNVVNSYLTSHTYSISTIRTVKIYNENAHLFDGITWFYAIDAGIVGTLDLSMFSTTEPLSIYLTGEQEITSIKLPQEKYNLRNLMCYTSPLYGTVDLSNIKDGSTPDIDIRSINIGNIIFPDNNNGIEWERLQIRECGLSGIIDLSFIEHKYSGVPLLLIEISDNKGITGFIHPTTEDNYYIMCEDCSLDYFDTSPMAILDATNSLYSFVNNGMSAADVNHMLVDLATRVSSEPPGGSYSGRTIFTGGNAQPDATSGGYNGLAAIATLLDKNVIVYTI